LFSSFFFFQNVLESYSYPDIVTWGAADDRLALVRFRSSFFFAPQNIFFVGLLFFFVLLFFCYLFVLFFSFWFAFVIVLFLSF
jgi:hypothetical protein